MNLLVRRRTLFILAILLGITLGIGYYVTPKLMAATIKNYEQAGTEPEKAAILRERLIKYFPGSEEARWEAYALSDRLQQQEDRIMIGPNFIGGGVNKNAGLPVNVVISYLERILSAQNNGMWKSNTQERIAQLYQLQGDYQKAEEYFLLAAKGFEAEKSDYRAAEAAGSLIDLYLDSGDLTKALDLTEQSLQHYGNQRRPEFLVQQGDIYFELGDYAKAEGIYREALSGAQKAWEDFLATRDQKAENINANLEDQPIYRHSKARLDLIKLLKAGDPSQGRKGTVKGEIYAAGAPLPNVTVYLVNENDDDGRMSNLEGIAALPAVKTDARGEFEYPAVTPGRYFIVLGLIPEDLEGLGRYKGLEAFEVKAETTQELKVVFQPRVKILEPAGQQVYEQGKALKIAWEEVPEAKSYNLHITLKLDNGYVSRVYRENLPGSSFVFNPQGLALREMNFVARGDQFVLAPSAVLGSFYPGAEIFFVIEAIDDQGRSISDSEGYVLQLNGNYPSIRIQGTKPLVAGDQLVIEKKYDEAVTAYETNLRENPSDADTLLSLARLYSCGWTEGTEDTKKAVEYYKRLLQVTREKFVVEEAASTAVASGNDELALDLFQQIEDQLARGSFWFHLMGELYLKTGQIEKALPSYMKYLHGQKEFRDLGPVIALLYQDDIRGALKLLQEKEYSRKVRYNPEGQTEQPADISLLINYLDKYRYGVKSRLSREDFHKYLLEIVRIEGDNRFAKVKAFQEKVNQLGENDILVQVLNELAKDRR